MKARMRSAVPPIFASVLLIMAIYVGSYLVLVDPVAEKFEKYSRWRNGESNYRYCGLWANRFFWPLETIDRRVWREMNRKEQRAERERLIRTGQLVPRRG